MATHTPVDLESREDLEPWRQSSFELHRGLEVTEIQPNGPKPNASDVPPALEPAKPPADLEAVYVESLERLSHCLPDPPAWLDPLGSKGRRPT